MFVKENPDRKKNKKNKKNKIFRKDVTYDNIRSHKKTGFELLFRSSIFRKTTGGRGRVKLTPSPHPSPANFGLNI